MKLLYSLFLLFHIFLFPQNVYADAEPSNDTCDGEVLLTLTSGGNTFNGTIENGPHDIGIDYYELDIPADGNITINWQTSQSGKEAAFLVGSSCDNSIHYNGSTTADTHTSSSISVSENIPVYLKVYSGEGKAYTISVTYDITPSSGNDLDIDIADSDDPVQINEYFYYIIDVSNSGTSTSTTAVITNTLASGVIFDRNTTNNNSSLWSCGVQVSQTVTCTNNGNIPSGDTHSLNLYVYAPPTGGTITHNASVSDNASNDSASESTLITAEIPNAENFCYVENTVVSGLNVDVNTSCEKLGNYYYGQNCTAQVLIVENNISASAITALSVTKMYKPELHGTGGNATTGQGTVLNSGAKSTLTIADFPTYEEGYIVEVGSFSNDANFSITDTGSYDNQTLKGIGLYADYNISGTHHYGRIYACDGSGEVGDFITLEDVEFNVVNDNFYPLSGTNYYNLPTQVTKRADNFKVIALDTLNPGSLKDINVSVFVDVELVDGDTGSGVCDDMTSLSNLSVQVGFVETNTTNFRAADINNNVRENDIKVVLPNADQLFYETASKNTYFRVSYTADNSGGAIVFEETSPGSGSFHLPEFESYGGQLCKNPFTDNKYNPNGTIQGQYDYKLVSVACANAGTSSSSGMSQDEVDVCMKCLFGGNTVSSCSKDNFAIRPEAFKVTLNDQNQTNSTSQSPLGDNVSGPLSLHLAADYNYDIEVNATNHYSDASSQGYTTTDNNISLIWTPAVGATACNDINNKPTPLSFNNGSEDLNITNAQVGTYTLDITDTSWTAVDQVIHTSSNFFINGTNITDCVDNNNTTPLVTAGGLNGCEISTAHDNNQTSTVYNDYNVTFHPYDFNLTTITPTVGLTATAVNANSYVYMADIAFNDGQDQNMSYHLNGNIIAQGFNGTPLSNFVANCYAKDINISIITSNRDLNDTNGNPVLYQYRFNDINSAGDIVYDEDENITNSALPINIDLTDGNFTNTLNGSMITRLNLNYNREINTTVNPKSINFTSYDVDCNNPAADCTFNADLTANKTTTGTQDLNSTIAIKHYYGRTNATRQRYIHPVGTAGTPASDPIYYEVFCDGTGCDKTLLQDGTPSIITNNPAWFINTQHTPVFGIPGTVTQKNAANVTVPVGTEPTGNLPDSTGLVYDGNKGYTYKATMENDASRWLIYNKYNNADTTNEFDVEFLHTGTWTGKQETSNTTNNNSSAVTNRRSNW